MSYERNLQEATPELERTRSQRTFQPRVDIVETSEDIVVLADMPGVSEKDVDVTLEKDVLTLEGRVVNDTPKGLNTALEEFGTGDYRRVFTLSTEIDRERISAEVAHGVLRLVLPKAEPAKAKRIVVKAG